MSLRVVLVGATQNVIDDVIDRVDISDVELSGGTGIAPLMGLLKILCTKMLRVDRTCPTSNPIAWLQGWTERRMGTASPNGAGSQTLRAVTR